MIICQIKRHPDSDHGKATGRVVASHDWVSSSGLLEKTRLRMRIRSCDWLHHMFLQATASADRLSCGIVFLALEIQQTVLAQSICKEQPPAYCRAEPSPGLVILNKDPLPAGSLLLSV